MTFLCALCPARYPSFEELVAHVQGHADRNEVPEYPERWVPVSGSVGKLKAKGE